MQDDGNIVLTDQKSYQRLKWQCILGMWYAFKIKICLPLEVVYA